MLLPGSYISMVDLKQKKYANANMDCIRVIISKILDSEISKATLFHEK